MRRVLSLGRSGTCLLQTTESRSTDHHFTFRDLGNVVLTRKAEAGKKMESLASSLPSLRLSTVGVHDLRQDASMVLVSAKEHV